MTIRDRAEIQRILEDEANYVDALFQAAEWCYKEHKDVHEAEEFIEAVKKEWRRGNE